MDINLLIWSFLIIFVLHNFEEIILIERWFRKTYPVIRERIPLFVQREVDSYRTMTAIQFSIVVCILTILASVLIVITIVTEHYFLFLGLNIIFALNIFSHPLQSIMLKSYVPGLWTTLLLIIPYNIIAFFEFYNQGILNEKTIIYSLFIIIPFIPVFLISHKLGEKWASKLLQ